MEWGTGPKADLVADLLAKDPAIDTVIVTHSETSTAAIADLQGIAAVTRNRDCLLVVDGITSVGAVPVKMDEWGVDVVVTSSQKALMTPPGLGFVAVNERAWQRIESFASQAGVPVPEGLSQGPAHRRPPLHTGDHAAHGPAQGPADDPGRGHRERLGANGQARARPRGQRSRPWACACSPRIRPTH